MGKLYDHLDDRLHVAGLGKHVEQSQAFDPEPTAQLLEVPCQGRGVA